MEDSTTDSSEDESPHVVTQSEPSRTNKVQQSSSGAIKRGKLLRKTYQNKVEQKLTDDSNSNKELGKSF